MSSPFFLNFYIGSVLLTWLGSFLFTLGHGGLTRWYKTENGVHLFVYGFAVTFCMFVFVQRVLWGEPPITKVSFAALIGVPLLGVAVWWRLVLFIRTYWRNRHNRKALKLVSNEGKAKGLRHGMEE